MVLHIWQQGIFLKILIDIVCIFIDPGIVVAQHMVVEDVCEFSQVWGLVLDLHLEVDGCADNQETG